MSGQGGASTGAWPAGAPDLDLAGRALRAAAEGVPAPAPELAEVAARTAAALSEMERSSILGKPLPFDAGPVRRAAAMRVRVGAALAAAPPRGAASDPGAVAALLAEIDDLLAEVNAIVVDAPPPLARALAACRNALVKEAIDFSETAQRYARADLYADVDAGPEPSRGRRRPIAEPSGEPRADDRARRGRLRTLLILLGICAAIGVAWLLSAR